MTIRIPFVVLGTPLVTAVWLSAATPRPVAPPAPVTFSESVAPILYDHCVTCHRPGEAAPFSLITYDDAAKRATTIANVTTSRFMPPWHAAHGFGDFADERRLTDEQIATLRDWVAQGTPRGDAAKMPTLPAFTDGWQLGTPDLVLEMPKGFEVPADGPDVYRNFAIPTGLTEDTWIRALEFRPSARRVVHHAIFQYVRGSSTDDLSGKDGKPGFGGAMPAGFVPAFAPSGNLGGWAVGTTARPLPDGLSWKIAKGSDLVLQLHFHPTGKVETERSTIGLYFSNAPSRKVREVTAPSLFGVLANIDIPAGDKRYTITGTARTFANMRAYSVMAHAHYLGKEMKAVATLPDGSTVPLLWIQNWDFNWQDRYVYKTPIDLPKGSKIDVTITWDNSADNPKNPCTPPRRVQFGLQSFDEMGGVTFQMVTASDEDEVALDNFNAAIAKAVVNQIAGSDTVKRLADQAKQQDRYKDAALGQAGCGLPAPSIIDALRLSPGRRR